MACLPCVIAGKGLLEAACSEGAEKLGILVGGKVLGKDQGAKAAHELCHGFLWLKKGAKLLLPAPCKSRACPFRGKGCCKGGRARNCRNMEGSERWVVRAVAQNVALAAKACQVCVELMIASRKEDKVHTVQIRIVRVSLAEGTGHMLLPCPFEKPFPFRGRREWIHDVHVAWPAGKKHGELAHAHPAKAGDEDVLLLKAQKYGVAWDVHAFSLSENPDPFMPRNSGNVKGTGAKYALLASDLQRGSLAETGMPSHWERHAFGSLVGICGTGNIADVARPLERQRTGFERCDTGLSFLGKMLLVEDALFM